MKSSSPHIFNHENTNFDQKRERNDVRQLRKIFQYLKTQENVWSENRPDYCLCKGIFCFSLLWKIYKRKVKQITELARTLSIFAFWHFRGMLLLYVNINASLKFLWAIERLSESCRALKSLRHLGTWALRAIETLYLVDSNLQNLSDTVIWWYIFELTHSMPMISWYPLKASENLWFSDIFRGYQKRSVTWNGLNKIIQKAIRICVLSIND